MIGTSELPTDSQPSTSARPWWIAAALVVLTLAGATLAALPHLLDLMRGDPPTYLADTDQLLYMGWSRAVILDGAGYLVDAVLPGPSPMMHPWVIFVPAAWLGHATGLGPMGLTILWRVLGGAGIALALFVALRPVCQRPGVALVLATLLMFDAGLLLGQPVVRSLLVVRDIAQGGMSFFAGPPQVMAHLRVVPPALVLPFLLASLGLITQARIRSTIPWALAAGAALGALFHVYLYFWTVVLGGLLLAFVVDPRGRRTFLVVIVVGCALGAPAVLASARIKATTPPDWLHRTEKFVPIGHFEGLLLPKMLILLWLASAWLVFRHRRELTWLWCVVGAGLACTNHQVVSGLQIENFHWLLGTGVAFSILLAALAAPGLDALTRRRAGQIALGAIVLAQLILGFSLRAVEVRRTRESNRLRGVITTLRADRVDDLPPGAVVAGDPDATMILAATRAVDQLSGRFPEFAARITDPEFDERLFLNLYLRGTSRDEARRAAESPPGTLSWESLAVHSPEVAATQRKRRLALVEQIWSDPVPSLERTRVSHVLVPAGSPNPLDRTGLAGRSTPLIQGRAWELRALIRPASTTGLPPATQNP